MKKTRVYLLIAVCLTVGFALGLALDKLFTKSYAAGSDNESMLPAEAPSEVPVTGTARSADYEIVTIYGRKYIIFSSGSDIEVLEY
jgi:hypothetical protein